MARVGSGPISCLNAFSITLSKENSSPGLISISLAALLFFKNWKNGSSAKGIPNYRRKWLAWSNIYLLIIKNFFSSKSWVFQFLHFKIDLLMDFSNLSRVHIFNWALRRASTFDEVSFILSNNFFFIFNRHVLIMLVSIISNCQNFTIDCQRMELSLKFLWNLILLHACMA